MQRLRVCAALVSLLDRILECLRQFKSRTKLLAHLFHFPRSLLKEFETVEEIEPKPTPKYSQVSQGL